MKKGRGLIANRKGELQDVSLDYHQLIYMDVDGQRKAVSGSVIYLHSEPIVLGGLPDSLFDRLDPIDNA